MRDLRDAVDFGRVDLAIVFLSEADHMRRLAHRLLQVPNHEILALVNREELAHARRELHTLLLLLCLGSGIILEVEVAPLDLDDGVLRGVVPDCQRRRETLVIQPIIIT